MINLVISRSQQPGNKCIIGDTEQAHMGVIADLLEAVLKNDSRFNVLNIPELNLPGDNANLSELVKRSNNFIQSNAGPGYHLALHSDGGYDGHGASAFYLSDNGRNFIEPIFNEVSKLWPMNEGMRRRPELFELKHTIAIAGLLEIGFHDQPEAASRIHNNPHEFVSAIIKGLYTAFKINFYKIPSVNAPVAPSEDWKAAGAQYLNDMGFTDDLHLADEPVDMGTLGTILKNFYKKISK